MLLPIATLRRSGVQRARQCDTHRDCRLFHHAARTVTVVVVRGEMIMRRTRHARNRRKPERSERSRSIVQQLPSRRLNGRRCCKWRQKINSSEPAGVEEQAPYYSTVQSTFHGLGSSNRGLITE